MLMLSIRNLGFITGWRYFQTYLKALQDPNFILEWADACDNHARKLEFFNKEPKVAEAARHWAKTLRECNKQIQQYETKIDEQ